MKILTILVTLFVASKALECGVGQSDNEELRQALRICIKNNETLQRIWDLTTAPTSSESVESEETSRKAPEESSSFNSSRRSRDLSQSINGKLDSSDSNSNDSSDVKEVNFQTEETNAVCIVHCVLENLQMTDNNGYPDRGKFVEGLVKNASDRELKDFLQDSANDCFHDIDLENDHDPCSYSTKLITCLATKGKSNCADWPVGNLPF